MIVEEKDRMECLRLAVSLLIPKSSGMKTNDLAILVIETAERFQRFIKKDDKAHE